MVCKLKLLMLNGETYEIECDLEMLYALRAQVNAVLSKHLPRDPSLEIKVP